MKTQLCWGYLYCCNFGVLCVCWRATSVHVRMRSEICLNVLPDRTKSQYLFSSLLDPCCICQGVPFRFSFAHWAVCDDVNKTSNEWPWSFFSFWSLNSSHRNCTSVILCLCICLSLSVRVHVRKRMDFVVSLSPFDLSLSPPPPPTLPPPPPPLLLPYSIQFQHYEDWRF